jgi:hypothetical protein
MIISFDRWTSHSRDQLPINTILYTTGVINTPSRIDAEIGMARERLMGIAMNTSPKCFRRLPYNTFRRHFGINTTWYLHSQFEWLKLSNSSIQFLLEVCLAAHDSESLGGLPKMSNFYCLPG